MHRQKTSFLSHLIRKIKGLFSPATSSSKQTGTIKFFDRKKRFGFIISGSNEYFFHVASTRPSEFKALKDGAAVTFTLIQGKKGLQADCVKLC